MEAHNSYKYPPIRFVGFSDAWEQCKLSDRAGFRRGSFPQPYGNKEWYDGDDAMPFVQVADVADDMKLVNDTKQKISKLAQPMSVFAEKGSVLVTLQGSIGRVAITQYGAFVDRTVLIFDKYSREICKIFWAYVIKEKFIEEAKKAPGGTIKTITKEVLSDFDLTLPNFEEQERIGVFLSNLDTLIALHRHKCENLNKIKKSMLRKMFPQNGSLYPEVRFDGFTDVWEQRKVGDTYNVTRGYVLAVPKTSPIKTDEKPFPVYSSQTKDNGLMGYYNEYLYENAITWTTDGANAGTVNFRAGKFYCTNVCGVLLSDAGYSNKVAAEALNMVAWKWVSHVGNPKLMNNVMAEIEIPLPPTVQEQEKISDFLTSLDNLITLHQRKCKKLLNIKQSLLSNMFV